MPNALTNPTTWAALSGNQPAAQLDTQMALLFGSVNSVGQQQVYVVDSGAGGSGPTAYACNLPAGWTFALVAGVCVQLKAANTNTGVSQLNAFASGPITIHRKDGTDLQAGDIVAGQIACFQYDGTNWQLLNYQLSGTLPRGYIDGLTLSNDGGTPATIIDIAAGSARSTDNLFDLTITAFTKTQANWVAGSGNGGKFPAAAMANNTSYHWFLIRKTADGSVDVGFDTSTTAANIPAGYAHPRYIGSTQTQPASTSWDTFLQRQNDFYYTTITTDITDGTLTSTPKNYTIRVPLGFAVKAYMSLGVEANLNTSRAVRVYDPNLADVAITGPAANGLSQLGVTAQSSGTPTRVGGVHSCWTNASQQVRAVADGGVNFFYLATIGYYNPRGQNA